MMAKWLTKLAYRIWDWIMGIDPVVEERLNYYCGVEEKRYTLKEIKEMYLPDRDLASLRSSSGKGWIEEE